ncbi:hypothetical protein LG634_24715 [Streptomyces bambusae]|uniref:hypothetical protein n=1 Tax=Streptomyces bambusae TaxID=1550616 RepID=UPI001CFC8E6B|nr:hypothetical protein [Streptomyces bambusae]MCB5168016.1 hypothetical protein [Streptomyces bambusae]
MAEVPITRLIPPGAPLPERPPEPDELPPWRQAPPPPVPPAPPGPPAWHQVPGPPPGPIEVHVTLLPLPTPPDPTRWERLRAWLGQWGSPWQAAAALALAVVPIPWTGHSAASTWAWMVAEARAEWGPQQAYALAGVPFALVLIRISRHGGSVRRLFVLAVAIGGLAGAADPFDIVTIITGVHR